MSLSTNKIIVDVKGNVLLDIEIKLERTDPPTIQVKVDGKVKKLDPVHLWNGDTLTISLDLI